MAVDLWTLEGGTIGANITVANSDDGGSGTAIQGISLGAGTTITYTDEAGNGNIGMAASRSTGSAATYINRQHPAGAASPRAISMMVMFPVLPSQVLGFAGFRGPGNVQQSFIALNAANRFEIRNASNVAISTASAAITAGVWYRIEQVFATTGTTTGGSGKWAYYVGNSATAVQSATISGANFGAATTNDVLRVGRLGDTFIGTVYFDDIALDNASDYIGGVGTPAPTMVRQEGVVYRIDLRTSQPQNAGTLTYPTPVKVSGATLAFTEPSDGLFIFTQDAVSDAVYTFSVVESGGGTTTNNYTIPKMFSGTNTRGWFQWSVSLNDWV